MGRKTIQGKLNETLMLKIKGERWQDAKKPNKPSFQVKQNDTNYTKHTDTTAVQQTYTTTNLDNNLHFHSMWYEEEEEETVGSFVAAFCDDIALDTM